MQFEIIPFHRLQDIQNSEMCSHIVIRYTSPGIEYGEIKYNTKCMDVLVINCHDVEKPMTPFNKQVVNDYPHFYKEPLVYFTEDMAKQILNIVKKWKDQIELIICQCHAGISRSSATAAALSKILNNDDFWVFDSKVWVPNNLIYRTILKTYYEGETF